MRFNRWALCVASLLWVAAAHAELAGVSSNAGVESYQFAKIPWGASPTAAGRELVKRGFMSASYVTDQDTLIEFTSRKELGFEYGVTLRFAEGRGLIAAWLVTSGECGGPTIQETDKRCMNLHHAQMVATLSSVYGPPDQPDSVYYSRWTRARDGSALDANLMLGIVMYRSSQMREFIRDRSLF